MRKFSHNARSGFTLIEVAIAVAILATGFATLAVIQGRSVDQSREEHNRLLGVLAAQFLLTHQLLQPDNLNKASDSSGDLLSELRTANFFNGGESGPNEQDYAPFGYELTFSPINYGSIESVLIKIESRVYWDGDPARAITVTQLVVPPKPSVSPTS
jgi:prepilin-type N-terminal cleavage/methylation domain-containing protein